MRVWLIRFLDEFVAVRWSEGPVCLKIGELAGSVSTEFTYLGALGVRAYMVSQSVTV
jgi:hypothetical protein